MSTALNTIQSYMTPEKKAANMANQAQLNIQAEAIRPLTATPQVSMPKIPKPAEYDPAMFQRDGLMETLYKQIHKNKEPETPEAKAKRERRERAKSTLMSFADSLGAVGNLMGTLNGANNIKQTPLSEINKRRYDYAKAVREQNEDAWRNNILRYRMADMQQQQAQKAAQAKARQDLYKFNLEQDYKERQLKHKQKYDTDRLKLDQYKAEQDVRMGDARLAETKRANKASEGLKAQSNRIAQINADTARFNAEYKASTGANGNGKFINVIGVTGKPAIRVPEQSYESFVNYVANQIIEAADKNNKNNDKAEIAALFNTGNSVVDMVSPFSKNEAIVSQYLHKYPDIDNAARQFIQDGAFPEVPIEESGLTKSIKAGTVGAPNLDAWSDFMIQ